MRIISLSNNPVHDCFFHIGLLLSYRCIPDPFLWICPPATSCLLHLGNDGAGHSRRRQWVTDVMVDNSPRVNHGADERLDLLLVSSPTIYSREDNDGNVVPVVHKVLGHNIW